MQKTRTPLNHVAEQLRTNRQAAGIKPSELDQAAYLYESEANLMRLSPAELNLATANHAAAILRATEHQARQFLNRAPATA